MIAGHLILVNRRRFPFDHFLGEIGDKVFKVKRVAAYFLQRGTLVAQMHFFFFAVDYFGNMY
jgi:hypothetical protein